MTSQVVRFLVPPGALGVYLLGHGGPANMTFFPTYIGRSDSSLRKRLLAHDKTRQVTYFRVRFCETPKEAFLFECLYWHALKEEPGILNQRHPNAPARSGLQCPYCSCQMGKL